MGFKESSAGCRERTGTRAVKEQMDEWGSRGDCWCCEIRYRNSWNDCYIGEGRGYGTPEHYAVKLKE